MLRYTDADIHIVAGRWCPYFGFWKARHDNHEDIVARELCIAMFLDMSVMKAKMLGVSPEMARTRAKMVKMRRDRAKTKPRWPRSKAFLAGRWCPYFCFGKIGKKTMQASWQRSYV